MGLLASWGPGVPTPGCLHGQGRGATTRKAAVGVVGSPPLGVWRGAHTGQRPLSTSSVLGSPPWLFEHRLATNKRRGSKAGASSPRRPPPHDAGTATGCRQGVAQAQHMTHPGPRLPAGSLHPTRGRDSAKAQAGPGRALAPTRVQPPAGSLPRRQCTVNYCAHGVRR